MLRNPTFPADSSGCLRILKAPLDSFGFRMLQDSPRFPRVLEDFFRAPKMFQESFGLLKMPLDSFGFLEIPLDSGGS